MEIMQDDTANLEPREYERKFLLDAGAIEAHRDQLTHPKLIEQTYLSQRGEVAELRVRRVNDQTNGAETHTATLKYGESGERTEIEVDIPEAVYGQYAPSSNRRIRKMRYQVEGFLGATVDVFLDKHDGLILAEVEYETEADYCAGAFPEWFGAEVTHDPVYGNQHLSASDTEPYQEPLNEAEAQRLALVAERLQTAQGSATLGITGRSGSGKSTLVTRLAGLLGDRAVVLNVDNYLHPHLRQPCGSWDDPFLFRTDLLRCDIEALRRGNSVPRRIYDFASGTAWVDDEPIAPAPVIIAEGLYACSATVADVLDVRHEVETPLATCLYRRLRRDMHSRGQWPPERTLRYYLEIVEPTYQQHVASTFRHIK